MPITDPNPYISGDVAYSCLKEDHDRLGAAALYFKELEKEHLLDPNTELGKLVCKNLDSLLRSQSPENTFVGDRIIKKHGALDEWLQEQDYTTILATEFRNGLSDELVQAITKKYGNRKYKDENQDYQTYLNSAQSLNVQLQRDLHGVNETDAEPIKTKYLSDKADLENTHKNSIEYMETFNRIYASVKANRARDAVFYLELIKGLTPVKIKENGESP